MKRYITTFLMAAMLAVAIPAMTTTSMAQTRYHNSNNRRYQNESRQYSNDNYQYDNGQYQSNGRPNVYDRHRKAMNITIATGAGAILGALFGGKKGALIGAAAGAAGGAIITAKQRPRNYYRRY